MGRLFLVNLEGSVFSCKHCNTHFALSGHVIAEFTYRPSGKGYLFDKIVNVTVSDKKGSRKIRTHTYLPICCVTCGSIVGWKYGDVEEAQQKYKEGKFILYSKAILVLDGR